MLRSVCETRPRDSAGAAAAVTRGGGQGRGNGGGEEAGVLAGPGWGMILPRDKMSTDTFD